MLESDLYCAVCGEYCGEGSRICPECRADAAKLAEYICIPVRTIKKDPRAGDRDYDRYRADQMTRQIRNNHIRQRR